MFSISRFRAWGIIFICILGILFAAPNFVSPETRIKWPDFLQNCVSLGLELRGGSHIQFEVDMKTVEKEYLATLLGDLRSTFRKEKIGYLNLKVDRTPPINGETSSHIIFMLRNPKQDGERISKLIKKIDRDLILTSNPEGEYAVSINLETRTLRNKQILDQSIEVIRRRIDESGTKEPTIIRQGLDRIVVQLPGVSDPGEVKKIIGKTAKLEFRVVEGDPTFEESDKPPLASHLEWIEYPEGAHQGKKHYLPVQREILLTGEHLIDAKWQQHDGKDSVSIRFDSIGSRIFYDISTKFLHKRLAIILDNQIITAPNLNEPIPSGQASISGSFTLKEANDLALLLRAGALPAPLKVVEERTVGPSLGSDSIDHGKSATLYAFILVSVFMILGYSIFGLFANIALIFNLILLFAGLSLLEATLTLPGIAGIAMTIGMAVDANVLIYERIKEELRHGLKAHEAIEAGYNRAMATIIDSNLTTLIGAAVLYEFSSGSIRGFAITLALGVVVSMFTALSVTKLITAWWFRNKSIQKLPI